MELLHDSHNFRFNEIKNILLLLPSNKITGVTTKILGITYNEAILPMNSCGHSLNNRPAKSTPIPILKKILFLFGSKPKIKVYKTIRHAACKKYMLIDSIIYSPYVYLARFSLYSKYFKANRFKLLRLIFNSAPSDILTTSFFTAIINLKLTR